MGTPTKFEERSAWVHSLTELEKLDDFRHLLMESIIVSTETIELKFK